LEAVTQLGYLGFEVSDLEAWKNFSTKVLGLTVSETSDTGFCLSMDSHRQRFFVNQGPSDDLSVIGWEVSDEANLSATVTRLSEAGYEVQEGSAEECALRKLEKLVKLNDPAGIPLELYYGPEKRESAIESEVVKSGFVADDMGLGHLVINAVSQQESLDFYCTLLGFGLSDYIRCDLYGFKVDIAFLHANRRHHSLALGEGNQKRMHHFMIEAQSMDEVGLAYDRAIRNRVTIAQTLGRHPNDRMFSFYAFTPSGFQFEFGWGGREIDRENWESRTYDHISEWGHHPPELIGRRAPKTR